jgi:hypothetical protein
MTGTHPMSLSDFVTERIGQLKCPLHEALNMGKLGELYAHYLIGGNLPMGTRAHDIHLPSGKMIEVKTGTVQRTNMGHSSRVVFSNILGLQGRADRAGLILIAFKPSAVLTCPVSSDH